MLMTARKDRVSLVEQRLEELEETIDVLTDKRLVRSIERGLRDLREGRLKRYADEDALFRDIKPSPWPTP